MADYRLFPLGPKGLIAGPPMVVTTDSDAQAMHHAIALATTCNGVEVWSGARLVCRIPEMARSSKLAEDYESQTHLTAGALGNQPYP